MHPSIQESCKKGTYRQPVLNHPKLLLPGCSGIFSVNVKTYLWMKKLECILAKGILFNLDQPGIRTMARLIMYSLISNTIVKSSNCKSV